MNAIGDVGNDRVLALGSDDEPRAERCRRLLVSANAITLVERYQEYPRG
jgi:hypothetical protein